MVGFHVSVPGTNKSKASATRTTEPPSHITQLITARYASVLCGHESKNDDFNDDFMLFGKVMGKIVLPQDAPNNKSYEITKSTQNIASHRRFFSHERAKKA
jgi:hypothetical protein